MIERVILIHKKEKKMDLKKIFVWFSILLCLSTIIFASSANPFMTRYNPFGRHLQYVNAIFDLTNDTIILSNDYNITQNVFNFTGSSMIIDNITTTGTSSFINLTVTDSLFLNNLRGISGNNVNLENNLDGSSYNITALWFKGLFNWNIGASPSSLYLKFNGSTLSFNETRLNITIDARDNNTLYYSDEIYINKNASNYFIFNETKSDERYLRLNGTNANTNINIGIYNFTSTNIFSNLFWNNLSGYPSACPAGSAVTTIDDSITCTNFLLTTGDTGTGDYVFENVYINTTLEGATLNNQMTQMHLANFMDQNSQIDLILGWTSPNTTEIDYTYNMRNADYHNFLLTDITNKGLGKIVTPDGSTKYLNVSDDNVFTASDMGFFFVFEVVNKTTNQTLIAKWDDTTGSENREWRVMIMSDEKLRFEIFDETQGKLSYRESDNPLSIGWHIITIEANNMMGATASDNTAFYEGNTLIPSTATNNANFMSIRNTNTEVTIFTNMGTAALTNFFYGSAGVLTYNSAGIYGITSAKMYRISKGLYNI
jgi:hypothetical protein